VRKAPIALQGGPETAEILALVNAVHETAAMLHAPDKFPPPLEDVATPLALIHGIGQALIALADLQESRREPKPAGYTSATYPHGPRVVRRHVANGMRAIKVGKDYFVSAEDAESYWATLQRKLWARKPLKARKLSPEEEHWGMAGLRVMGSR